MINQSLIKATEDFVRTLFLDQLSEQFVYHDLSHTLSVKHFCEVFGQKHYISDAEMTNLIIAALLHDTGYTQVYEGHEAASQEIARAFLEAQNYPDADIDRVVDLIEATIFAQAPENIYEGIIKDADLSSVGSNDYLSYSDRLREEWDVICNLKFTDKAWCLNNIEFLNAHQFYSEYAAEMFGDQKKENIESLKKMLKKMEKKNKAAS